ncbi:hypothetical protein BB561_001033 [Smittium simulii]|uniref:SH3 domain-containing protein n=1 Tax=Smittium simulii TaxID=133385 RepID=A0A2T9YWD9_9FUNG|nr:hypothetical protein BB561_001033 [Smittium simulii]
MNTDLKEQQVSEQNNTKNPVKIAKPKPNFREFDLQSLFTFIPDEKNTFSGANLSPERPQTPGFNTKIPQQTEENILKIPRATIVLEYYPLDISEVLISTAYNLPESQQRLNSVAINGADRPTMTGANNAEKNIAAPNPQNIINNGPNLTQDILKDSPDLTQTLKSTNTASLDAAITNSENSGSNKKQAVSSTEKGLIASIVILFFLLAALVLYTVLKFKKRRQKLDLPFQEYKNKTGSSGPPDKYSLGTHDPSVHEPNYNLLKENTQPLPKPPAAISEFMGGNIGQNHQSFDNENINNNYSKVVKNYHYNPSPISIDDKYSQQIQKPTEAYINHFKQNRTFESTKTSKIDSKKPTIDFFNQIKLSIDKDKRPFSVEYFKELEKSQSRRKTNTKNKSENIAENTNNDPHLIPKNHSSESSQDQTKTYKKNLKNQANSQEQHSKDINSTNSQNQPSKHNNSTNSQNQPSKHNNSTNNQGQHSIKNSASGAEDESCSSMIDDFYFKSSINPSDLKNKIKHRRKLKKYNNRINSIKSKTNDSSTPKNYFELSFDSINKSSDASNYINGSKSDYLSSCKIFQPNINYTYVNNLSSKNFTEVKMIEQTGSSGPPKTINSSSKSDHWLQSKQKTKKPATNKSNNSIHLVDTSKFPTFEPKLLGSLYNSYESAENSAYKNKTLVQMPLPYSFASDDRNTIYPTVSATKQHFFPLETDANSKIYSLVSAAATRVDIESPNFAKNNTHPKTIQSKLAAEKCFAIVNTLNHNTSGIYNENNFSLSSVLKADHFKKKALTNSSFSLNSNSKFESSIVIDCSASQITGAKSSSKLKIVSKEKPKSEFGLGLNLGTVSDINNNLPCTDLISNPNINTRGNVLPSPSNSDSTQQQTPLPDTRQSNSFTRKDSHFILLDNKINHSINANESTPASIFHSFKNSASSIMSNNLNKNQKYNPSYSNIFGVSSEDSLDQKYDFIIRHKPNLGPLIAVEPYEPQLSDELGLCKGHEIYVIGEFSDGWVLAINNSDDGKIGMIPRKCVFLSNTPLSSLSSIAIK